MALDTVRSIGSQYRPFQTRRLFTRLAGICTALVIAAPVNALSCLPYGIAEALDEVIIAQEGYVAATGVLSFNERKLPKAATDNQFDIPPTTLISARLKGKSLRKDGFTQRFNKAITLEVKCYASWCAHPKSGEQALVFLQQTKSGYLLTTNPCGGHIFTNPTRAALDSVVQCYTKGICPKSEYR